jgi:Do/DeqQ family serine protease
MNNSRFSLGRWFARTGVAVGAAALLVTGAWHMSAAPEVAAQSAAAPTTSISHAIAGGRDSYADVVRVIAPSVVTIRVEGKASASPAQFQFPNDSSGDFFRRFFGDPGDRGDQSPAPRQRAPRQRGLGSGVIVSGDGYILTNNHVVENADDIRVEMTDGRTLAAKLIGTDKASDLALIKIDSTGLHPAAVGNSDNVQVGDVVLAVGNPLGVGQTVTMGIISAKGRSTGAGSGSYEDFLQTDAPINQGNSGGALVNTKGELVGINSQILSNGGEGNIGIGFAIPSNMAKHVMDELRTSGKVTRAQLGVIVQPVTSDLAESLGLKDVGGALIGSVTAGSAADHAGLKRGDVIMAFNGQAVHDTNTLRNRVAEAGPGSTADVTIVRDAKEKHVSVKLDQASGDRIARRDSESGSVDQSSLGVSVAPLTPELASRYRLPRDTHGIVVQDVDPNGRAADAGIQAGDVIEEVNRQPVQSVEDLRAALRRTTDRPVLLLVNREGSSRFVTVRPNNG